METVNLMGLKEFGSVFSSYLIQEWRRKTSREWVDVTLMFRWKWHGNAYGKEMHESLARNNPAPTLHCCGDPYIDYKPYYDITMTVMNCADGDHYPQSDSLSNSQHDQLRQVLMPLEDHRLIHGDLRCPDIMVKAGQDTIKVLDFEWAGKAGEVRYPAYLNMAEFPGAKAFVAIQHHHDRSLINRLASQTRCQTLDSTISKAIDISERIGCRCPASGKTLNGKQTVKINEDGRFISVSPTSKEQESDNATVVDLDGLYICPGLIDCHVHVTAVPGVKTIADLMRLSEQEINLRTTYNLKEMLHRGFTTVRDTGGASKVIANAIEEGLLLGPKLFQCGKALSQTGGHGDFIPPLSGGPEPGCCGGHSRLFARVADGVPTVLSAVRGELKAGADPIKIMVGGGVASETDAIETVQYTAEEIRVITTTCKQMGGKLSTAHTYTADAIRHAIDNGVLGIEHGNLIDVPTANLMASKGIYLTPTLSCYGIMVRPPFEDFLPPDGKKKNAEVMKQGLETLRVADNAGVTICYGSDLLTSMQALQTEEFTVRSQVLSSPEILKHATTNAAKMLNKSSLLGTISVGAYGDLLVLNADPLEDVTILDRPEDHLLAIVKEGRIVMSKVSGLEKGV
ncbi:xaa--pro dipeptidase [Moniliophthora roreri MCA 2997]|uniref:Xaa--pro dipeptidase n=1 Tax=Moniliophthora roreri (strain MCA 2997) TaxID=1381753 RepID=V2XMF6_MONRO|nr:xaa--pro dipeptidase [Moniliophthora roreri MCA 2997]